MLGIEERVETAKGPSELHEDWDVVELGTTVVRMRLDLEPFKSLLDFYCGL